MKARKYCGEARACVRSEFLAYPLIPDSKFRNRSLVVLFHSVVRAVVPVIMQFLDSSTIMVRSDPSSMTDSVPIISGLDCDTFTLVKVEVPNFRVCFRFSLKIFSLTSLSYFLFHTWLYLLFLLLSIIVTLLNEKNKKSNILLS